MILGLVALRNILYFNSEFILANIIIVSSVIVNSCAFLSGAPGSGDWATTPHLYDLKQSYLTLSYLSLVNH